MAVKSTMRAFCSDKYGLPSTSMKLLSINKPVPREDEVLIKVHSVSLNPKDWRLQTAEPFLVRLAMGLFKPKNRVLGGDVAGEVEAVGAKVTNFNVGDAVFGEIMTGSFAEYTCAKESQIARKPTNMSFEVASTVPLCGFTALQSLRDFGKMQKGHKVLVNGASGGVGLFTVQLAKHLGAAHVTATCSEPNVETMYKMGADHVIDYTKEDICAGDEKYDVIINNALVRPLSEMDPIVADGGSHVLVGGSHFLGPVFQEGGMSKKTKKNWTHTTVKYNNEDLVYLKDLAEQNVLKPHISKRYTFEEIPQALDFLREGHPGGKLVVNYL